NCITPALYAFSANMLWLYLAAATLGAVQTGIDLGYLNTTLRFAEPGRAAQYQAVHSTFFGLRGTIAPLMAVPLLTALHQNWGLTFALCLGIIGIGVLFQML